ncbi:hypothetical protein Ga0123461_1884 [Mariprofundus aestuarium]|uniref:Sulfotransferase family protein n=1 Tax=Mariprofundus aestuarium TaxID=1921086 RepID=A0A2K8L7P5_MARES|nr:hypothetical protein [Mariprofundus aestuarium]ATX80296.1 hypothetical protein Ga0123461_1884 [Mariprofundus aestuarium]
MKNFIVFTQGRTGSTAIVDELDKHPQIMCHQELFIHKVNAPKVMEAYEKHGPSFMDHVDNPYRYLPMEFFFRQFHSFKIGRFGFYYQNGKLFSQKKLLKTYLEGLKASNGNNEKAVGFKILVNHFHKWPELYACLLEADYSVIYLERRNVVKKVLSGMVAEARGVYNRKNFTPPDERYHIDVAEFIRRVDWTLDHVRQEKEMLRRKGFPLLEIGYEDFLEDRDAFFKPISKFLGIDHIVPEQSDYTVMINKHADEIVSNYAELKDGLSSKGLAEQLDQ